MEFPNFHDGHFDGFWLRPNKLLQIFLRTADQQSFVLELEGVRRMILNNVKEGSLILDLVFRPSEELTDLEIESLFDMETGLPKTAILLTTAREEHLQILEINPSYGAEGLILFHTWKITSKLAQP